MSLASLLTLPVLQFRLFQPSGWFPLIWQLVLVKSGDSRPIDCQNQRKQGTRLLTNYPLRQAQPDSSPKCKPPGKSPAAF